MSVAAKEMRDTISSRRSQIVATIHYLPMPTFFCTLGTSWAVVPEAFLLGNGTDAYSPVTLVTTNSETTRLSLGRVTE